MPVPEFDNNGDLPEGIHRASIEEVVARFGSVTPRRRDVTATLLEIYQLVKTTGKLDRFVIYGSYLTAKPEPNDVDIFLVMTEEFEVDELTGKTRIIFSHIQAQHDLGASVFWVNRATSFANIEDLVVGWQTKRDLSLRGIIEVTQ
ncbi:MAG: DUF6932 family protein [Blastocatellia bacterium]